MFTLLSVGLQLTSCRQSMKTMIFRILNRFGPRKCIVRFQHSKATIFAHASGHGKCAVSVFRISGPNAKEAVVKLGRFKKLPEPRVLHLRKIVDPRNNDIIDKGLISWFPAPKSFTGEDYCEFHVHGGSAIQQALIAALAKLASYRLAKPGEFTKRAYQNNKLDLAEIEGLGDVINAETEAQRKQAMKQMMGLQSRVYKSWSDELLRILAHIEAYIDFGEDQDLDDGLLGSVVTRAKKLNETIARHLADKRKGERIRSGVNLAIVGEPNVGKSSLLNVICQRPAAIVSPTAGTTRDVIDVTYDIDGFPVRIGDTAGLRKTEDFVEIEGIKRALLRIREADLLLWVVDACTVGNYLSASGFNYEDYLVDCAKCFHIEVGFSSETDSSLLNEQSMITLNSKNLLVVVNKIDLLELTNLQVNSSPNVAFVSCLTGTNIDALLTLLGKKLEQLCGNPSDEDVLITNTRHRLHLTSTADCLRDFESYYAVDVVLAAESLRRALRNIGHITGEVTSSRILDVIFKDFCIGK